MTKASSFWFHHQGVSVMDMDAQIAWYSRVLGFTLTRRRFVPSVPAEVAVLNNGPLHFELFRVPNPIRASSSRSCPDKDVRTTGNKHVAFSCNDVNRMIDIIRNRGGDVVWVKEIFPDFPVAFIRDHEGNLIEFVQYEMISNCTANLFSAKPE